MSVTARLRRRLGVYTIRRLVTTSPLRALTAVPDCATITARRMLNLRRAA